MKQNLKRITPYLPYIIFGLCTVVLLMKAQYSFCWSDETFYFSTTNRFYQGDGVFLHEWFPTQLVSLLLLPLYSLYIAISGSAAGILLFFRICFVLFSLFTALITYRILNKDYSRFISLCAGLMVLFYAHLNIATLSYYTMSVNFYLISMLLLSLALSNHTDKPRRIFVLAGVSFAAAVICLPTMAVAYFICSACLILVSIKRKELRAVFPYTLIGICILAVVILAYILSHVGIMDILDNLQYVLSDEEHTTSLIFPFKKFFISINEVYHYAAYAGYLLIVFTCLFGRKLKSDFRKWIFAADILLFLAYLWFSIGHTGYISTAVVMFAVPLYFMTEKRNKRFFFLLFLSGMIFSFVFSYSSNGYLYIMTLGHSIAAIGALCFIADFMTEVSDLRPLVYASLAVIAITVLQTMTLRIVNIYRDAPLTELTERLTEGPAKGLYTTPEHADSYKQVLHTIQEYDRAEGNIFFTKLLPWGYLVSDMKCGAPTTWRTTFDSERLDLYYKANPDRIPDMIFVVNEDIGSYETCGDIEADPAPNANEIGGWLLDYVTEQNYTVTETEVGIVYEKGKS